MSKIKLARTNMLKQQLRTMQVSQKVVNLMAEVPREKFVPKRFSQVAYADMTIPLQCQEAMMPPRDVAQMLHGVLAEQTGKVLIVGVESGYTAALLARRAKHVYVVDTQGVLLQTAQHTLSSLGVRNVSLERGNASRGWSKQEPYNTIVITGSLPFVPPNFIKNLSKNGRIFAIIGDSPAMAAVIAKRGPEKRQWIVEKLFETDHPRLPSALDQPGFVF